MIFLNGEREIRDTADALSKRNLKHTDILPLYSRLSNAEQNRIFAPHSRRHIILSTNVAETSLTVPGIRYVIPAPIVQAWVFKFGQTRLNQIKNALNVQN